MHRIAIVPLQYLEMTAEQHYHMVLAQKCDDADYCNFFKRMKEEGKYLILDNGAAEGEILDPKHVIEIAKELKVDEVVLPDVFNDYNGTCQEYHKHISLFKKELPGVKIMAVLPSTNELEIRSFVRMVMGDINVIGIPKVIANGNPHIRVMIAQLIAEYGDVEIHYLGAIDVAGEERYDQSVRSIDSAIPYVQACKSLTTFEYRNRNDVIDNSEGYEEDDIFLALLRANLDLWWRS